MVLVDRFFGPLRPASQILALHVYNMQTMSTISRLCRADRVYMWQTVSTDYTRIFMFSGQTEWHSV